MCLVLMLVFSANQAHTQDVKEFYFGLDLGPKMDIYKHSRSSNQYKNSVEVIPDIGANAGIIGGMKVNDEFLLEIGLYKNDYKMKLQYTSDQGNIFFRNTLIKTITSVGVPVSFNMKLKRGSPKHQWYVGAGFMPLMNVKTEQDIVFTSVVEEIQDDQRRVTDQLAYTVSEQKLAGSIVTANVSLRYNLMLTERMAFHIMGTARMGVSGRNEFSTTHSTLNYTNVVNDFYTKGSGYNLNVGFRLYLEQNED